jgi:hypothetical protein
MKRLRSAVERYLTDLGRLSPIPLGPSSEDTRGRAATREDSRAMAASLAMCSRFNRNLVIVYLTLHCVVLCVGALLVFYVRNSPLQLCMTGVGTLGCLLALLDRLHRLWVQKCFIDLAGAVLLNLAPNDAARFIETLYWTQLRSNQRERRAPKTDRGFKREPWQRESG